MSARAKTGQDVLEYEILQEQAATIGRLAEDLRRALDALKTAERDDPRRARLVNAAAYALWHFVVQRECSGFRDTEYVLRDYRVPVEVRAKMGTIRAPV
jgi:hypothetical protein